MANWTDEEKEYAVLMHRIENLQNIQSDVHEETSWLFTKVREFSAFVDSKNDSSSIRILQLILVKLDQALVKAVELVNALRSLQDVLGQLKDFLDDKSNLLKLSLYDRSVIKDEHRQEIYTFENLLTDLDDQVFGLQNELCTKNDELKEFLKAFELKENNTYCIINPSLIK